MRLAFPVILSALALQCTVGAQSPDYVRPSLSRPIDISTTAVIKPIPPSMDQRASALRATLKPGAQTWIDQQAAIETQRREPDLAALRSAVRQRFASSLSNSASSRQPIVATSNQDIDAIVFLVMMQSTHEEESELQSQLQQMKSINQQKQSMRQLQAGMNNELGGRNPGQGNQPCATPFCKSLPSQIGRFNETGAKLPRPVRLESPANPNYAQLAALQSQIKDRFDSINEMSEMTSMRLQMAMDRRSKILELLSNINKSINDTQGTIIQNMK